MSFQSSVLIEILQSIRHKWKYAGLCIERLESGTMNQGDILSLCQLIEVSLQEISTENTIKRMNDTLFLLSILSLEEGEMRKYDLKEANIILSRL